MKSINIDFDIFLNILNVHKYFECKYFESTILNFKILNKL